MPATQDEVSKHIPSLCPHSKSKYLRFKEKSQSFLITVKVNLARKIVSAVYNSPNCRKQLEFWTKTNVAFKRKSWYGIAEVIREFFYTSHFPVNLINCDMRKYTGLTQLQSDCHLKISTMLHCLGLYNDPSDINFVHVHQNAIRNAYKHLLTHRPYSRLQSKLNYKILPCGWWKVSFNYSLQKHLVMEKATYMNLKM